MKFIKVIIFLYLFSQIGVAGELDSTAVDFSQVEGRETSEVQNSDTVNLNSEASQAKDTIIESANINIENRKDTILSDKDTSSVFNKNIDKEENKDTIKIAASIKTSQNLEDPLKIKYPYYYKNSKTTKIVAGIGISLAISGIVYFIVINQMKTSHSVDNNIPPPPPPPSYLEYNFVK